MQSNGLRNNYNYQTTSPKLITKKTLNEIDKRRLLAIKKNDLIKVEEFNNQVLGIIKVDGLESEHVKTRLDAAFKTIPYLAPTKKAIETTITFKKIEDIIQDSIKDVEFTEVSKKDENE